MSRRDYAALKREIDVAGMYERIRGLPEQIAEAAERFDRAAPAVGGGKEPRAVVLLGMGGSAIGGEIVATVLAPLASAPVVVLRGYGVPAWCGPGTLVVATSYSGNTEETLAASAAARKRGADFAAVTSGGRLGGETRRAGLPVVEVPGGSPPRAAIGHLTISTLLLLERAGVGPDPRPWIEETVRRLAEARDSWGLAGAPIDSPPACLAEALDGTFPVLYHGGGETAPVATRWGGQLAENAKVLSHRAAFPELNHNEIVGWEDGGPKTGPVSVVAFESPEDPPGVRDGREVVLGLIDGKARHVLRVFPEGESALARVFGGVYLGDFVSWFLAMRRGVDPTPVRSIDELKGALAKSRQGSGSPGAAAGRESA